MVEIYQYNMKGIYDVTSIFRRDARIHFLKMCMRDNGKIMKSESFGIPIAGSPPGSLNKAHKAQASMGPNSYVNSGEIAKDTMQIQNVVDRPYE